MLPTAALASLPPTASWPSRPRQGPRAVGHVPRSVCHGGVKSDLATVSASLLTALASRRFWRTKARAKVQRGAIADVEVKQRQLLAEVEILSMTLHPKKPRDLVVVQVTDPDFPEGPPLPIVTEPLWCMGDKAILLQVGCRVPKAVARFGGLFRRLAGAALAKSEGAMEGPLNVAGVESMGLLLPWKEGATKREKDLERLEAFQSRVAIQLAYCGDDFRGSLGSDASVEVAVRNALLQVGVVPAMQKPPFQRLSRTDAGVHARSFWLVVPLLRLQVSDLQPNGTCPGLAAALNRRLPKSLRVLEVVRIPYAGDVPAACNAREYRYYLPRNLMGPGGGDVDLTVERRLDAALRTCQGQFPFLNFTWPENYGALEQELRSTPEKERWLRELFGHRRRRRERGYPPDNRIAMDPILQPVPEEGREMTVRDLRVCELMPEIMTAGDSGQEFLCIRMVGEGFLNSMVRMVVGSSCAVARGVLPISELREALQANSVVDLSEFLAPAAGLVLHEQHMDEKKVPWMPFSGTAAADAFLREEILSRVERAWQKTRSPGVWYQPGPAVIEEDNLLSA